MARLQALEVAQPILDLLTPGLVDQREVDRLNAFAAHAIANNCAGTRLWNDFNAPGPDLLHEV